MKYERHSVSPSSTNWWALLFSAYQERLRAASLGYEDPILPSFEATTAMYESALTEVLKQINQRPKGKIAVMVATHNEDTVRMTINK